MGEGEGGMLGHSCSFGDLEVAVLVRIDRKGNRIEFEGP